MQDKIIPANTAELGNGKHPRGLYVLFFTEMWERFGYYLMIGIFFLYLTDTTGHGGRGLENDAGDGGSHGGGFCD